MFAWLMKLFRRESIPDGGAEQVHEASSADDALYQNAMRAMHTGKTVVGEWDGEKLTNRVVDTKK